MANGKGQMANGLQLLKCQTSNHLNFPFAICHLNCLSRVAGNCLAGCGKRLSAMLRGAQHLQYLRENKQMQILRFAQDDSRGHFFRGLLVPTAFCLLPTFSGER